MGALEALAVEVVLPMLNRALTQPSFALWRLHVNICPVIRQPSRLTPIISHYDRSSASLSQTEKMIEISRCTFRIKIENILPPMPCCRCSCLPHTTIPMHSLVTSILHNLPCPPLCTHMILTVPQHKTPSTSSYPSLYHNHLNSHPPKPINLNIHILKTLLTQRLHSALNRASTQTPQTTTKNQTSQTTKPNHQTEHPPTQPPTQPPNTHQPCPPSAPPSSSNPS